MILSAALLTACGATNTRPQTAGEINIDDLHVVDCLLPGQLKRLGNTSYMTPRRPVHTTAADCHIRGGEFVVYDRADYRTALNVWLPSAEAGDADAQANVGEIFERGLGDEPNYAAAVIWYKKAAEQGNKRAQFNLGTLYEQGLGVEKDALQALNWYRLAWGLEKDHLIYQSAALEAQQDLRKQLQKTLDEKATQIALLTKQIQSLESRMDAQKATTSPSSMDTTSGAELAQLNRWVASLKEEHREAKQDYDAIPHFREPESQPTTKIEGHSGAPTINVDGMEFGRYYALIIANQNYANIDDLQTPYADAMRAKELLESKYGFQVTVLLDGDNASVMQAINKLGETLTEEDNLLIFYAGHGSRISTGDFETGYWLPVNASPPPDDTYWVSNEFVSRHLARIKAKRVMVVADSCYAGLLSSAPGYLFMKNATYGEDYIRYKLPNKSRLLISSGGDQPVLDNNGQGHSVFARAFLDVLEETQNIISAPELFIKVRDRVAAKAKAIGLAQVPELKAIKGAGHEVGDFFFVSK